MIANISIMNKILDVMDDIKQNITDDQYKKIIDSLKEIYDIKILKVHHLNMLV